MVFLGQLFVIIGLDNNSEQAAMSATLSFVLVGPFSCQTRLQVHCLPRHMEKKRIILADDQLLVRAGIRALLETLPQYEVIAECADGQQAIDASCSLRPDVVLLDIAMPGVSGIEAARHIHACAPDVKILILSSLDLQDVVMQALSAGASGYLHKDFILDELRFALGTLLGGGRYLSPRIQDRLINQTLVQDAVAASGLTPRQTEVLRLVAAGQTTKETARTLGISPKTVEFHRAQIMEKLGVHDVTGLTRYAVQQGLIT